MNCKVIAIKREKVEKENLVGLLKADYLSAYDSFLKEFDEIRVMAHELKSPFNAVSFLEFLDEEYKGSSQDDFILKIEEIHKDVLSLSTTISKVTGVGYNVSSKHEEIRGILSKDLRQITSNDVASLQNTINMLKTESSQFRVRYEQTCSNIKFRLENIKREFDGLTDAVDSELLSGDGSMYIGMVKDSIDIILGIVSADVGGVREVSMIVMISRIQDTVERMFPEKETQVHYDGPDMLKADYSALYQIINNLVTNAVKYNHNAPVVKITVNQHEAELLFDVSDNGIGIDPKHHGLIFEKNQRVPGVADKFEGSGIGLDVVKSKVEEMGGTIRVESQIGSGSSFFFNLPYLYD